MNGPQHYSLAEHLLEAAKSNPTPQQAAISSAEAQVHATLALAAATWDAACLASANATGRASAALLNAGNGWDEATS